jgi:hypothetical protein
VSAFKFPFTIMPTRNYPHSALYSLEEPPSSPASSPAFSSSLPSSRSPKSQLPLRVYHASGPRKKPTIAVIGRPNVGKSALVNRLAGTQSGGAIVADESGITRDRTYRVGEFMNKKFQIVDTGGLVFDDKEVRWGGREESGVATILGGRPALSPRNLNPPPPFCRRCSPFNHRDSSWLKSRSRP